MQRSTGQPLFATDDMGNLHQMVVNDISKMVGRQLIDTLVEHLVIEDVGLHAYFTANHVVD